MRFVFISQCFNHFISQVESIDYNTPSRNAGQCRFQWHTSCATSPPMPKQSHMQAARRFQHARPMTSPQRIHHVIAPAVHACHSTQSRQSRCMPTMSSIFLGLAPSFSSTTLTMPLQHSAVRCRLVVATVRVRVSFRSGFGSKAGIVASSE